MGTEPTQSPEAIQAQLRKILESKPFRSSELPKKFLSYVVQKTLDGQAAAIKEYSIGVEAFGRGENFDPRIDSVVRVVARRVRERLAEYYQLEGKDDSLVIQIPIGSYLPTFSPQKPDVISTADSSSSPQLSPEVGTLKATVSSAPLQQATKTGSRWLWVGIAIVLALIFLIYVIVRPAPSPKILRYRQVTHDGQGKLDVLAGGTPPPLATDGSRIYFNEVSGSQVVIKQVAASGGETVTLNASLRDPLVVTNMSPDRSELLATGFFQPSLDGQLFKLQLPGATAIPLGQVQGHDGAWSPEGTQICYANGNRLYLAANDGTGSKEIAELPGIPSWPRWSPDGTRLRVTVQDSMGGTSLWEVSWRGNPTHPLFSDWKEHPTDCCGSWSPDGKYFIFQSTSQGNTGLWAIHEDTWRRSSSHAAAVPLTQAPLNVWAPVFNVDGRSILAAVQQRRGELVRYDAASNNFVVYLGGLSADHVEFSRDAQWIAYSTYPEQTIWRSRVDGSERLQLSFSPLAAIFPRWSPDGQRIAFMGTLPGKATKIYIVPSNGGTPEPLLTDDTPEIDPNWSSDGNSVMFAKLTSETQSETGNSLIQILDLKTRQLSTMPGSTGLTAPRWSPDGRFVVATALSHGKWSKPGVLIFDFKTGKWTALENDPIDNKWWSSDGKYFYFDKFISNDPAIYRLRLSDYAIERIVALKDIRRSFNMMGWWMGLTPDGSPMVLRDTSIEEIYALDFSGR